MSVINFVSHSRAERAIIKRAPRSYFRSKGSNIRPQEATGWKVRDSRLKEVLLRDKPEVIRLHSEESFSPYPNHFFHFLRSTLFFLCLIPSLSLFSRITVTIVHLFSFNTLIYWLRFSLICFLLILFFILLLLQFSIWANWIDSDGRKKKD